MAQNFPADNTLYDPAAMIAWRRFFAACGAEPVHHQSALVLSGCAAPPVLTLTRWRKHVQCVHAWSREVAIAIMRPFVTYFDRPVLIIVGPPTPGAFQIYPIIPHTHPYGQPAAIIGEDQQECTIGAGRMSHACYLYLRAPGLFAAPARRTHTPQLPVLPLAHTWQVDASGRLCPYTAHRTDDLVLRDLQAGILLYDQVPAAALRTTPLARAWSVAYDTLRSAPDPHAVHG